MSNLLNVRHHDYHIKMVTRFNHASKAWTDTQKWEKQTIKCSLGEIFVQVPNKVLIQIWVNLIKNMDYFKNQNLYLFPRFVGTKILRWSGRLHTHTQKKKDRSKLSLNVWRLTLKWKVNFSSHFYVVFFNIRKLCWIHFPKIRWWIKERMYS